MAIEREVKDDKFLKRRKLTEEEMEREIEYRSYYSPDDEFPQEEIQKTLEQLNLADNPRYRYDQSRNATQ